jgi:hypothetical protein
VVHRGQHEQGQRGGNRQTADHHGRDPALHVAADARMDRRRQHAQRGDGRGHEHRTQTFGGALHNGFVQLQAGFSHAIEIRHHDDAVLHRDAKQRDESDAAGDIEILSSQLQRDQPADRSIHVRDLEVRTHGIAALERRRGHFDQLVVERTR